MHPIPSEMLVFELNTDDTLEGLPPLWPGGHSVCDFLHEFQIWTRLTIEHFSTLKQSILNESWPTRHDAASGPCSHMASFLHDIDLVGNCRWHGGLCLPKVVSGSISGPNVNDRIMPMSDAVLSAGPKTTGIQQTSSALSLTHRDYSSVSESFDYVMHCRL